MRANFCNGLLQLYSRSVGARRLQMIPRQKLQCTCACSTGTNRGSISDLKKDYVPKVALNNISAKIKSQLKVDMSPKYEDTLSSNVWQSSLTIKWPDYIQTVGKGNSKIQAQQAAAESALLELKRKNIIDDYGNVQSVSHRKLKSTTASSNKKMSTRTKDKSIIEKQAIESKENAANQLESQKISVSKAVLEMVARRYPQPKVTLHNTYAEVARCLRNETFNAVPSYQLVRDTWLCSYRLRWPTQAVFSGEGRSKSQAAHTAALYALHWLVAQGRLLRDGTPCIERKMEMPPPPFVSFPSGFEHQLSILQSQYQTLRNTFGDEDEDEISNEALQGIASQADEISYATCSFNFNNRSEETFKRRSYELERKLERRTNNGRMEMDLPVHKFRDKVLEHMENNQVVIIKGETGCGKSTQIPQFIFDKWTEDGRGAECSVVVTEPRRIAAISLAERVAEERDETVGDVVGYQVRLQSCLPQGPGGIVYMSSGMLLRHLQTNPVLTGVSHIVLDEVHERDINIDVLAVLLRRALLETPELRLVVMSATIDASLFQKYFDAPLLEIPGFTFPVTDNYLCDLVSERVVKRLPESSAPFVDADLVCNVISWIHKNKSEGAILCFMPGWAEIKATMDRLSKFISRNETLILPAHSRISYVDQRRIFSRSPPGVRKIILATNIAETSITINDVKYVVDTGLHREQRLNSNTGTSSIGNRWISKVNVKQRRGRAGRLQPGESFHLFTREHYKDLNNFPIPEVLRVPLEKTILDCKGLVGNQKAAEFLSELPEPPSREAVELGVSELIHIGALDFNENLTALGKRIMHFPTHPKLSKALVNATILRCTQPVLTITTMLSGDVDLFQGTLTEKDHIRETKREYHPTSDHIALWKLHRMLQQKKAYASRNMSNRLNINSNTIDLISRLNRLFSEYLYQSEMLPHFEKFEDDYSACNSYQDHDELVQAVLMSGLGNLLVKKNWKIMNGRIVKDTNLTVTESEQHATITTESVNYKQSSNPSPYFTHFNQIKSLERRSLLIRESSLVSPLCVILFKPGELVMEKCGITSIPNSTMNSDKHVILSLKSKATVKMLCEKRDAEQLIQLRNIIWWTLNYYIKHEGSPKMEYHRDVDKLRDQLLKLLVDVLSFKRGTT